MQLPSHETGFDLADPLHRFRYRDNAIAKGTLPLALFGPQGYGLRSGLLSAPARMLQAASPFLFGVLLDRVGIEAAGLSVGLCLAAFGSLFLLRPRCAAAARPSPVRS